MRNLILTLALVCGFVFTSQAQNAKGDFYVGTGDITGVSWTDWAISPTVGYAFTDALVIGGSISQADAEADMNLDFYARYFWNGMFIHAGMNGLNFDEIELGLGKQFTLRDNVYVDPTLIYNAGAETVNLGIGFGFKF
jgi:hypothetical protein